MYFFCFFFVFIYIYYNITSIKHAFIKAELALTVKRTITSLPAGDFGRPGSNCRRGTVICPAHINDFVIRSRVSRPVLPGEPTFSGALLKFAPPFGHEALARDRRNGRGSMRGVSPSTVAINAIRDEIEPLRAPLRSNHSKDAGSPNAERAS